MIRQGFTYAIIELIGYSRAMVKWKIIEIMNAHGISPSALASELEMSRNAISVYRRSHPRISNKALNNLLNALNKLRRNGSPALMIQDLIEYIED